MKIIKLKSRDIEDDKIFVVNNIKDKDVIFAYSGSDYLYEYIDNLELSNNNLFRLKIFKEITGLDVCMECNEISRSYTKLSDLLADIDINKKTTVIVKGDLNSDDESVRKTRRQLSNIIQQFIYLNIPLDRIQVMTELEYKNNEKVKRFSESIKLHEKNILEAISLLSSERFSSYTEIRDDVYNSIKNIEEYLNDAGDNELKIATAASKKSGKSMIVNSMLKSELAPTSLELATPNNCIYRKSVDGYTLDYKDKRISFNSEKEIRNYIYDIFKEAEKSKESGYGIPDMEIGYVPLDTKLSAYTIYDTPGPDLAGASGHKEAAYKAIEDVDVVIFSIDYSKYLTETETEYLKKIREKFTKDKKYYSLIINVNKLDCRYSNEGDKNCVRILDFIRKRLIDVAPEFEDAIVIGTSALMYFDCVEMEKIDECSKLNNNGSFRDDLEDLIEEFSSDSKKDEEVNAMQFINTMVSNIKTFDGVRVENIEQVKQISGMTNLISYIDYIAQNKARVEKVNSLMNKIDNEYVHIQNLFTFQQLEEKLAENHGLLDNAKKVINDFISELKKIFDSKYRDGYDYIKDSIENCFSSETLKKLAGGEYDYFKVEMLGDRLRSEYIDNLLDDNTTINHVLNETIKNKLKDRIDILFKTKSSPRKVNKITRDVVDEQEVISVIDEVCKSVNDEVVMYIHNQVQESICILEDENSRIRTDLGNIVNNRLDKLKKAMNKCENSLQEKCGFTIKFVTTKFEYCFRNDIENLEDIKLNFNTDNLIRSINYSVNDTKTVSEVHHTVFHNVADFIFGSLIDVEYNRITWDKRFIMEDVYKNCILAPLRTSLYNSNLKDIYSKYKKDIQNEVDKFCSYIVNEMNDQLEKSKRDGDEIKKMLDHTSEYEENITALEEKRNVLNAISNCVNGFCDAWRELRES